MAQYQHNSPTYHAGPRGGNPPQTSQASKTITSKTRKHIKHFITTYTTAKKIMPNLPLHPDRQTDKENPNPTQPLPSPKPPPQDNPKQVKRR